MDSSRLEVCSVSPVGLAGATGLGSDSTMISKSTSFSVKDDMWLEKQKEYSPSKWAVKMKSPCRSRSPSITIVSEGSVTVQSMSNDPPD